MNTLLLDQAELVRGLVDAGFLDDLFHGAQILVDHSGGTLVPYGAIDLLINHANYRDGLVVPSGIPGWFA